LEPRSVDLPGGARIEYLSVGDANATPVVYFHGAGGVFRNAAFMPALGERFHAFAPSRPGYDGSTGPAAREHGDVVAGPGSARDEALVMGEFIRTLVGGPAHVIAESAGGAAGLWLAVLEPASVLSLTLVAPTAFAHGHAPPPSRPTPEAMELRLFGPRPAWSDPTTDEDRARRQKNASSNAGRIRAADGNAELLEHIGEISAQTLILWGTADEVVPPEDGQVYTQRILQSYRVLVHGGAHSLPVAACRQFVTLATDFIQRGDHFVVAESRAAW
jgi:pimeloyl-ACP methyl ester carboxylesterase